MGEKDPKQEDFLQGSLLATPSSSTDDPAMGLFMPEIKKTLCTDCELIVLLENDNAMEWLGTNQSIQLPLPVADVSRKGAGHRPATLVRPPKAQRLKEQRTILNRCTCSIACRVGFGGRQGRDHRNI